MLEFAHAYPGMPLGPDLPWPLFVAGCARISRLHSRAVFQTLQGVSAGVGAVFGDSLEAGLATDRLFRAAFPLKRTGPKMALTQSEDADGG